MVFALPDEVVAKSTADVEVEVTASTAGEDRTIGEVVVELVREVSAAGGASLFVCAARLEDAEVAELSVGAAARVDDAEGNWTGDETGVSTALPALIPTGVSSVAVCPKQTHCSQSVAAWPGQATGSNSTTALSPKTSDSAMMSK